MTQLTQSLVSLRRIPLSALFGLTVICLYILIALFAPVLAPFGESEIVGGRHELWSAAFIFGTDQLGRDMLTRLIYGARNTLAIAFLTTLVAFLLGTVLGLVAAALGGWADMVISRAVDVVMAIPALIFSLLLLTIFGTSITSLILVIACVDAGARLSPCPSRCDGSRRHGFRRSRAPSRRKPLVGHPRGNPAQRCPAAGRGIRLAVLFRLPVDLGPVLPGSGYPARPMRIGGRWSERTRH